MSVKIVSPEWIILKIILDSEATYIDMGGRGISP